jgi:hypothetical protein
MKKIRLVQVASTARMRALVRCAVFRFFTSLCIQLAAHCWRSALITVIPM